MEDYYEGPPPAKKRRTLSPTCLAEFEKEDDTDEVSDTTAIADSPMDIMDPEESDECPLTTEVLFSDYISNDNHDDNMVQKGLGLLWGRLGGGEFAASVTMAVQRQRAELLNLGGHWSIVNIMTRDFPNNSSIQIQCCSILKELLLEGGAARYQVYCAGGMDAVIAAMNRFRYNPHMQLRGCQFLARMLISPVSTAILEDLIRSTMHLDTIVRLLQFQENACCAGSNSLEKEIRTAATNLLISVVEQAPCGMRTELVGAIQQQAVDMMGDDEQGTNLLTLLEDCDSYSVRDEQHVL